VSIQISPLNAVVDTGACIDPSSASGQSSSPRLAMDSIRSVQYSKQVKCLAQYIQESASKEIELKDDDPRVFERLLHHLYLLNYQDDIPYGNTQKLSMAPTFDT